MREISKVYYIQEAELCILLALKGKKTLYGLNLSGDASMTQEALYRNLFAMQKKGILIWPDDSGKLLIEEGLDDCVKLICDAERFIVFADADELMPERYFYTAGKDAVMLQPAGQYDAVQPEGAFYIEKMPEDAMWDILRENGFGTGNETETVPYHVRAEAQGYWNEDKNAILQHSAVEKLFQEYDVCARRKTKQCIKFACGLDTYIVCGDEGGVKL